MNYGWEQYNKKRTLNMKRLVEFIREHPDGVTATDLDAAGLNKWGLDRLIKLGHVKAEQVREPERGPRAYHWRWRPITACMPNMGISDIDAK